MKNVYILQHIVPRAPESENVKVIGIYSSEQKAAEAIKRLKSKPGFATVKEGFHIDKYELNKDHWTEGFV
jgi:hypothetical protein